MHPVHVQRVQVLQMDDYEIPIDFAHWHLRKCDRYPLFPAKAFFSDEVSFTMKVIFNRHNGHMQDPAYAIWGTRMQYDVLILRLDFR